MFLIIYILKRGDFMEGIFSKQFEVTLLDVGENNELSNKGILRFLQEIACIHSGLCGSSLNNVKETGIAWVVLNWKLHVFSRPRWNTTLTIKTWSSNQKHISFYRDFEITDEDNNLVAVASSKWVPLDVINKTFAKMSPELISNYHIIDKHAFDEPIKEKLAEPEGSAFVKDYTVLQRDLDTNHHMNNLIYLDLACEALPVNFPPNFSDLEIMYKHEAKLGDVLEMYFYCENNKVPGAAPTDFACDAGSGSYTSNDKDYIITIKNKFTNVLHTIVKLKN